jgi:hypothetical protein
MKTATRLLGLGLCLPILIAVPSCKGGKFGGLGASCPQLGTDADPLTMSFSANARANAKIRAFVASAKSLVNVSLQMEALATDACLRMGTDLGLTPAQMAPRNDEPGAKTQAACGAVAAQIDAILRQGIQLQVRVTPPQCQANLQAKAQCEGACDVEVDPGQIVAQCEPARLSGHCNGRCVGRCDGTCSGQCQGQCAAYDAQGQCAGQCNGTCQGACNATCHAHCEGEWQAPRCEGQVRPPSADAECNASCNAHANFNAQCTPAQVAVYGPQNVQMAARLMATLQANLPNLLYAQLALGQRVIQDAKVVVQLGGQLPKVVGDAGLQGMACIAAAANATARASARIDVSVRASASVSGRVGAG